MQLAEEAVAKLPNDLQVDIVASPALGGILFGFAVASALDATMIFSERVDGVMVFRRSFEVPQGARILVVEDVVTTGGSVKEICDLITADDGEVVGVVSMIDRADTVCFEAPYYPLLRLKVPSWERKDCDLCNQGIELTSPGSRSLKAIQMKS
jgi:orotate phosphoribosyltransferase